MVIYLRWIASIVFLIFALFNAHVLYAISKLASILMHRCLKLKFAYSVILYSAFSWVPRLDLLEWNTRL